MKTSEIRDAFLNFFKKHGHQIVPSSSLIPYNDETLLFTNAGMVQFKETFLGKEQRKYTTATSSQRCVRAGGKHNDLENVGYTARHHTFFEMLGNFSFGDYFKEQAIEFAWDFLTKELKLPPEKLWVTVFHDDKESEEIWFNKIGIDQTRFSRCGEKDNFWSMGDTGPCGPCTEIFYDHGESVPGGPPGSPDEEGDRYVEIWNLVFMQYNRAPDGSLDDLPAPSVDTGAGLERLSAVLQGVHSNYDTDLFQHLISATAKILKLKDKSSNSLKVLADHIRASSFLIMDGVIPSNEGRGYVLRRIIRRALRHGHQLGAHDTFFYKLLSPLIEVMGEAYPELKEKQSYIEKVLTIEDEQFSKTLDQGLKILEDHIATLKSQVIPGDIVFKLYDTYGFPMDLTRDIAREKGLSIDEKGFEHEMAQQRQRARKSSQFQSDYGDAPTLKESTDFSGYVTTQDKGTLLKILRGTESLSELSQGEKGTLLLDNTPFYAESGGQVGDQGLIRTDSALFRVHDTQKSGNAILHHGELESGSLTTGEKVDALVDAGLRQDTALNHSATHLLHAALRQILGSHVQQKGSLVAPDKLRFDFSHFEGISPEQLHEIESRVNDEIRGNSLVQTDIMSMDEAMASGAMALFGEKYGEKVRVLNMGEGFSVELCGGTHVKRTGDIGLLKITQETGIASGVRRIEAITGRGALKMIEEDEQIIQALSHLFKADKGQLIAKVNDLQTKLKELEKDKAQWVSQQAQSQGASLIDTAKVVNDMKVLAAQVDNVEVKVLRDMVDDLKNKLGSAAVVLGSVQGDKVSLIAGVTKDNVSKIKAGELVNFVAQQIGGKGGGRPDMAQAGGNQPDLLPKALDSVVNWVQERLK